MGRCSRPPRRHPPQPRTGQCVDRRRGVAQGAPDRRSPWSRDRQGRLAGSPAAGPAARRTLSRAPARPAGAVDAVAEASLRAGRAAGETSPVALRLLPARRRRHRRAVYGFARTADDIGDEAPPEQRLRLLDELETDLRRLYARYGGNITPSRRDSRPGGGGAGPQNPAAPALLPAPAPAGPPPPPLLRPLPPSP